MSPSMMSYAIKYGYCFNLTIIVVGVIIPDQLFDKQLFESEVFQRPFQYIYHLESGYQLEDMLNNTPLQPIETPEVCLDVLLR